MGVVIAIFFVAAARYIFGNPHDGAAFFTRPFYDPQLWNTKAVLGGTSVAVLTYIGFDGISTLSEEAENPRRNILLATVLVCVVIGILSAFQVYAAQLIWPASQPYPNVDTAFTFVAGRAWAPLFAIVGFTLVVANFGSGMGAQLGAARLLYGMGRSSALPKSFFGVVDAKRHVPRNNVLFVGALALAGAFFLPWVAAVPSILARFLSSGYSKDLGTTTTGYELGANLLNFGALIAFMGVNAAAFVRYYLHEEKKKLSNLLPPVLGFVICLFLWLNLSTMALIFGAIWMAVGIAFGAWKTKGFRGNLVDFELPPEEG
jgi:amino acid transporter